MMRSYFGLSLCLMFIVGCLPGPSGGGDGGTGGGEGGTGGTSEDVLTLGCSNNITADVSILPTDLQVDSGPITGGEEFAATLSGTFFFPVFFLDAAQTVIPGGVRIAQLVDAKAIVQVRSGATQTDGAGGNGGAGGTGGAGGAGGGAGGAGGGAGGAGGDNGIEGVTLLPDLASLTPGLTSFCNFSQGTCSTTTTELCNTDADCPSGETCTGIRGANVKPCDQASDNPDGTNPDCLPVQEGVFCQDPIVIADLPTSEDCTEGGVCDALGKGVCEPGNCVGGADAGKACNTADDCASPGDCDNCGFGTQCGDNQFCITGPLAIAFEPAEQTYVAAPSGEVLFGWADQGLTNPTLDACFGGDNNGKGCTGDADCPGGECVVDLYSIPQPVPGATPLEQGLAVVAGGLSVEIACVMAVDSAGPDGLAVCVGGANDGQSCQAPADAGDSICFGGANDGASCQCPSTAIGKPCMSSDCPNGECANAVCGVGSNCEPTDLASYTPDSALIRFTIQ